MGASRPYDLVIFDLDGTLADSLPWFLRHVNDVADRFGFRRIADADIDSLRRADSREIVKRLDVPMWKLPRMARYMRRLKGEHIADIDLFPGVDAMLRALAEDGVRLVMVTSDSEANARRQLGPANAALFGEFACGVSLLGKAAKFRRAIRRSGVAASRVISIGDELRDVDAARTAGIACAGVTWGYAARDALHTRRPDIVFDRIEAIAAALLAPRA